MFYGSTGFNKSLANWDVSNVIDMNDMFGSSSGMTTSNYDNTLIAWDSLNLENGITFDAGSSTYCDGLLVRENIISNDGWTINDGGEDCTPDAITTESVFIQCGVE